MPNLTFLSFLSCLFGHRFQYFSKAGRHGHRYICVRCLTVCTVTVGGVKSAEDRPVTEVTVPEVDPIPTLFDKEPEAIALGQ